MKIAIAVVVIALLLAGCFMQSGTLVEEFSSISCSCEVREIKQGEFRITAIWDVFNPRTGETIPLLPNRTSRRVGSIEEVKSSLEMLAKEPACAGLPR